jgi:hypothetical protein
MRASSSPSRAAKAKPRNLKRPKLKPSASSSTSGRRALLCEEHVVGVVVRPLTELEPYALNALRYRRPPRPAER